MEYLINLAILFCIYGTLALSLNMVVGMAGLLSLAQAAFYGIGAYAAAIGMTELGLGFFSTLLLGMLANGILAFVVGKSFPAFRETTMPLFPPDCLLSSFPFCSIGKTLPTGLSVFSAFPSRKLGVFAWFQTFPISFCVWQQLP